MSNPPLILPQTKLPPTTLQNFVATHQAPTPTPTPSPSPPEEKATHYPSTTPTDALKMHTRRNNMVETRTTKPTLMTRLRGRNANTRTVKTTTKIEPRAEHVGHTTGTHTTGTRTTRSSRWGRNRRTAEPVVHHRRHASIGDKISGAMLKLKGSLTHRPGVKAAGTRRMHGTDGRGSHRVY